MQLEKIEKRLSVLAMLAAAGTAFGQGTVLFDSSSATSGRTVLQDAAAAAGVVVDTFILDDFVALDAAAADPTTTALIIDNNCCFFGAGYAAALQDRIDDGAKVHQTFWNTDADPAIQAAMGISATVDFFAPREVHDNAGHPSWAGAASPVMVDSDGFWADNGDELTPGGGATVVSTHDSPVGPGATVVANGDRTLANGFDYDSLVEPQVVELVTSQLRWLCSSPCLDWTNFSFGDVGDVVTFPLDVSEGCQIFKITDSFLSGDRFDVRISQGGSTVAQFSCSDPTVVGDSTGDFDEAFGDLRWSSGSVLLAPGSYRVEVRVTASPFGSGGAGYRLCEGDGDKRILVYDENTVNGYAAEAADFLGAATVVGESGFNAALLSGVWDVVLLDMPSTLLTDFGPFINYVDEGGAAVVSTWGDDGFGGWQSLLAPLGASSGESFSHQATPDVTSTRTPCADQVFAGIPLPAGGFVGPWGSDGCRATLAVGSEGLAQLGGAGRPVMWISNARRTIGSFLIDEWPVRPEAVRLWGNMIRKVCDGGDPCGFGDCRADIDGDGVLTIFDFLGYQNLFASGDLCADFDGDGMLTLFDFLAFQNEFALGCP
ncbi:MAG: GC-type dockerin domain-anchored protein [Planctomycetota bacterium]